MTHEFFYVDEIALAKATKFPERVLKKSLGNVNIQEILRMGERPTPNVLGLEIWMGALAATSMELVDQYLDTLLVSSAGDDIKEQACFLGTSLGSTVALEHLYRQVKQAFKWSSTRRLSLSPYLEALTIGSGRIFDELTPLCETFMTNRNQSLESRSSAESLLLANRSDFSALHRKIRDLKNDGLACRFYIQRLALSPGKLDDARDLFEQVGAPNQIALIEALCATASPFALEFLMYVLTRKERAGWFRSSQNNAVKASALAYLELFTDRSSEELLRKEAANNSDLSIDAACALIRRFPGSHDVQGEQLKTCVKKIGLELRNFFFGSPLSGARVKLRKCRAAKV